MRVELIDWPENLDVTCGTAAAMCTGSEDPRKALRGAMARGHESVAEHAFFTFGITGVSRVLLAQLTRHRLASFSVQSQRYVNQSEQSVMIPPDIKRDKARLAVASYVMDAAFDAYDALIRMGVDQEDARYVLPQGVCTTLVMTMNARELRHFLSLRMCRRAQWEIRELADIMCVLLREKAPQLFHDAGPECLNGPCPEGRGSCGQCMTYAEIAEMEKTYGQDGQADESH